MKKSRNATIHFTEATEDNIVTTAVTIKAQTCCSWHSSKYAPYIRNVKSNRPTRCSAQDSLFDEDLCAVLFYPLHPRLEDHLPRRAPTPLHVKVRLVRQNKEVQHAEGSCKIAVADDRTTKNKTRQGRRNRTAFFTNQS